MEKFTFDILGQKMNISIKKDDHDEIVKVLKFYRKKVQELEKLYPYKSSLEIAILAGVRITDEYYACYNERTSSIKKEDNNHLEEGDFVLLENGLLGMIAVNPTEYTIVVIDNGRFDTSFKSYSLEEMQGLIKNTCPGARIIKSKNIVITEV